MEVLKLDELIESGLEVTATDVTQFYIEKPGHWVLMEPTEYINRRAEKLKVIKYDKEKDALRNHLMDLDDHSEHPYVFFFTGHDGTCKI